MSNHLLIEKLAVMPNFGEVLDRFNATEGMPEIKTFFANYRNPIGVEIEAEGITDEVSTMKFWGDKDDGSLRNHGREFVSKPLCGRQIDYALYEIEQELKRFKRLSWSVRTSIHVHQNMAGFRENQLMAYCMVYGLFEPLFYGLCDPHRQANAFCYPATNLEPSDFASIHDHNKYCGLNLYPLRRYGTVEWRQMSGTNDFKLIRRWIQLIVKLHAWVDKQDSKKVIENVLSFIDRGAFVPLVQEVFGANAALFRPEDIEASGKANALWSVCLSTREFS